MHLSVCERIAAEEEEEKDGLLCVLKEKNLFNAQQENHLLNQK